MAIITRETNHSLKSLTAEGSLLELLFWIRASEKNSSLNPNGINNIIWNISDSSDIITGTFNLPIQTELQPTGGTLYRAVESLSGFSFIGNSPSGTGTFKAQTPNALLMEIADYLQNLESIPAKNPQEKNNLTATIDRDKGVYSGSFTLPFLLATIGSGTSLVAVEYLL